MKSMIFIAPPAAGKGTQAKLICEEYNLEHISTGDLLRIEALNNSDIKAKMDAGEFISDDIILSLIKNKIKSLGSKDGYILDGFPRNINQAEAFNEMLENVFIEKKKEPLFEPSNDIDKEKKRIQQKQQKQETKRTTKRRFIYDIDI